MAAVRRLDGKILTQNTKNKQIHVEQIQEHFFCQKIITVARNRSQRACEVEQQNVRFDKLCTLLDFSKSQSCPGELIRSLQYAFVHIPMNCKGLRSPQPKFK
jgi:hypothetical protein